jgi:hypothetical protein
MGFIQHVRLHKIIKMMYIAIDKLNIQRKTRQSLKVTLEVSVVSFQ